MGVTSEVVDCRVMEWLFVAAVVCVGISQLLVWMIWPKGGFVGVGWRFILSPKRMWERLNDMRVPVYWRYMVIALQAAGAVCLVIVGGTVMGADLGEESFSLCGYVMR